MVQPPKIPGLSIANCEGEPEVERFERTEWTRYVVYASLTLDAIQPELIIHLLLCEPSAWCHHPPGRDTEWTTVVPTTQVRLVLTVRLPPHLASVMVEVGDHVMVEPSGKLTGVNSEVSSWLEQSHSPCLSSVKLRQSAGVAEFTLRNCWKGTITRVLLLLPSLYLAWNYIWSRTVT